MLSRTCFSVYVLHPSPELDAKGEVHSNYDLEVKSFEEMGLKPDLLVRTVCSWTLAAPLSFLCVAVCVTSTIGLPRPSSPSAASTVISRLFVLHFARPSGRLLVSLAQVMALRSRP